MPAKTDITPVNWDQISRRIHAGRCVPFLGAGVNASSEEYAGLPLGGDLAQRLLELLIGEKLVNRATVTSDEALHPYPDLTQPRLYDLARVALYLEAETDSAFLADRLETLIPDQHHEPSDLLKTLARLPFRLIVTTNYDRLMERALEEAGTRYKRVVQPLVGFEEETGRTLDHELFLWFLAQSSEPAAYGPILYKLHGTLGSDNPDERPLITEDDYIQFLTVLDNQSVGIPGLIRDLIQASSLLILGYSMQDWDFRSLYYLLTKSGIPDRPPWFAIHKHPSEFWLRFWKNRGIYIFDLDVHDFARELAERYQRFVNAQQMRPRRN